MVVNPTTTPPITITAVASLTLFLPVIFIAAGINALTHTSPSSLPSANAVADIPANYLQLYQQAAQYTHTDRGCPALDWSILAGIGKVETDHGRSTLPGVHGGANSAGAEGPMQFLPETFVRYDTPVPPGGATPPSPYDPVDAIYAAARYLCASGADHGDIHAAIWTYNHADWYVTEVLNWAHHYAQAVSSSAATCDDLAAGAAASASGPIAAAAVRFACQQLGKPYVWGGNGNPGFDCSGLTAAAYAAAGVPLPRVAQDQYNAGPLVQGRLIPGDLVFFGTSTGNITHVGIAVSPTDMINAPDVGQAIRIDHIGPRFVGAVRPASRVHR